MQKIQRCTMWGLHKAYDSSFLFSIKKWDVMIMGYIEQEYPQTQNFKHIYMYQGPIRSAYTAHTGNVSSMYTVYISQYVIAH